MFFTLLKKMHLAQEGELNNEKHSQCHNLYFRLSLRAVMVQKDDKCISIRLFHFYWAVYHDEELPAELMPVTQVNTEV